MNAKKATPKSNARDPLSEEARLCVDFTEKNSFEAIDLLRNAGFKVMTTPVSGLIEPELTLGSTSFNGIKEIKKLVDSVK